jgi:hypothetical protein
LSSFRNSLRLTEACADGERDRNNLAALLREEWCDGG